MQKTSSWPCRSSEQSAGAGVGVGRLTVGESSGERVDAVEDDGA